MSVEERVLKMGMKDSVKNSRIALPIVAFFELFMIVRWLITNSNNPTEGQIANLVSYIFLFLVSLIFLYLFIRTQKNIEEKYKRVDTLQKIYAVLSVFWALRLTQIGCVYYGNFDYLVFITIITIVPVYCFIEPAFWIVVQFASSLAVVLFAWEFSGFVQFLINFSVFTIISIVASRTLYRVRTAGYVRFIELEQERDITHRYAYSDQLTGLPNRRSYDEDLKALKEHDHEDLILAMFDINGLKRVNDSQGHDAGDELIIRSAISLQKVFLPYGKIYRVGGDEFTGILHGSKEKMTEAKRELDTVLKQYEETKIPVSLSLGFAFLKENPNASLSELETMADNAMYLEKRAYYETHGTR